MALYRYYREALGDSDSRLTDSVALASLLSATGYVARPWTLTEGEYTTNSGLNLLQQIEGLVDQTTRNGATLSTAWKIPGVDPLPTGITISGRNIMVGSAFTGNISGWDFRGYTLLIRNGASVGIIENNLLGDNPAAPVPRGMGIYGLNVGESGPAQTASVDEIRYNTFYGGPVRIDFGLSAFINQRIETSGCGQIRWIHHNRFEAHSFDGIKVCGCTSPGGQLIEWNAFIGIKNVANPPLQYNASIAYSLNAAVSRPSDGWNFISKISGNAGNPLPTATDSKTTSNDWWQGVDPHSDYLSISRSEADGVTIRYNYLDQFYIDGSGVGLTNSVRIQQANLVQPMNHITVQENVMNRISEAQPAIGGPGVLDDDLGPLEFIGNWIVPSRRTYGTYFYPSLNGRVDVWTGNRDYLTSNNIPGPTLRA